MADSHVGKLAGVNPQLVLKVMQIFEAMRALGFEMMVTDGVRTLAKQQELFARGRTQPGKIVTMVDGATARSKHQVAADGYGRAVDCAFLLNGAPSWANDLPWRLYGEMAKALGLIWGGEFSRLVDRPHVELP
jgi:peptidoglycan LD-endopeptidase CwlK